MKILGIIPARKGSKGVPNKNIKQLGELPLLGYSIKSGLQCKQLDKLIVSTDGEEIAEISKKLGAEIPFLRPESLATDNSPSIDFIIHALEYYKKKGEEFDAVCLLQPTVPFRNNEELEKAILRFERSDADSLISVRKIPHQYNPYWSFVQKGDSNLVEWSMSKNELVSRRQNLPDAYHRDGSVYLTKTSVLLESKSLYGNKIAYFENKETESINIDTQEDWELAEKYLLEHGS